MHFRIQLYLKKKREIFQIEHIELIINFKYNLSGIKYRIFTT